MQPEGVVEMDGPNFAHFFSVGINLGSEGLEIEFELDAGSVVLSLSATMVLNLRMAREQPRRYSNKTLRYWCTCNQAFSRCQKSLGLYS